MVLQLEVRLDGHEYATITYWAQRLGSSPGQLELLLEGVSARPLVCFFRGQHLRLYRESDAQHAYELNRDVTL